MIKKTGCIVQIIPVAVNFWVIRPHAEVFWCNIGAIADYLH